MIRTRANATAINNYLQQLQVYLLTNTDCILMFMSVCIFNVNELGFNDHDSNC